MNDHQDHQSRNVRPYLVIPVVLMLIAVVLPTEATADGLTLTGIMLAEPEPSSFSAGIGIEADLTLTKSFSAFARAAFVGTGTWDARFGAAFHFNRVVLCAYGDALWSHWDGFIPQLGVCGGVSFALTSGISFFNRLWFNIPLSARFMQAEYSVGMTLAF